VLPVKGWGEEEEEEEEEEKVGQTPQEVSSPKRLRLSQNSRFYSQAQLVSRNSRQAHYEVVAENIIRAWYVSVYFSKLDIP
jgi:hypothetical protein